MSCQLNSLPGAVCGMGLDCQQPEAALSHTQAFIRGGCHTLHAAAGVDGGVGAVGRRLAAAWLGECCGKHWRCRLVRAEGQPQARWVDACRLVLEDVLLEGQVVGAWHALHQRQLGGAARVHLQPIQNTDEHDCNKNMTSQVEALSGSRCNHVWILVI